MDSLLFKPLKTTCHSLETLLSECANTLTQKGEYENLAIRHMAPESWSWCESKRLWKFHEIRNLDLFTTESPVPPASQKTQQTTVMIPTYWARFCDQCFTDSIPLTSPVGTVIIPFINEYNVA